MTKIPDGAKTIVIVLVVVVVLGVGMYFISKTFGGIAGLINSVTGTLSNTATQAGNWINGTASASTNAAVDQGIGIYNQSQTATSPWNPNFYKSAPSGAMLFTSAAASNLAEQMWDAVPIISFSTPDPSPVIGAINQCQTQSQVSFLADTFNSEYGKDMFTWIYSIWYKYGAKDPNDTTALTVIQTMNNFVQSLPAYNA